ncbi:MAG: 4-alpha-glucanotransferase [Thermodesulfobacteriota bacterium]
MELARSCGILAHLTSLPSPFGIGDLGPGARRFVDFLAAAGQTVWQMLPVTPAGAAYDYSPYMSDSAFAGNQLLLSPEDLAAAGWLSATDLGALGASPYLVEFERVAAHKAALARKAFAGWQSLGPDPEFAAFCAAEAHWLDDYALFAVLKAAHQGESWCRWPRPLARRHRKALAAAARRLATEIDRVRFGQYCFQRQWQALRAYAADQGVRLIGDLPIYVGHDSAEVWANQDFFLLDRETGLPTEVSGVPPDYFSRTGQRWGTPLYRWHDDQGRPSSALWAWWARRFAHLLRLFDVVRVDHFRGFESYWSIPAAEETAVAGRWLPGPGQPFFRYLAAQLGDLPIIAEDLGLITPEVEALRDALGLPGMKVLQFAFDAGAENAYLPHNFRTSNCVVYTGTHDNDTTVGWYFDPGVPAASKARALRYAHSQVGSPVHWDFLRLAYSSVAALAVLPLQDVLGFGSDCRMNTPSVPKGNWRWRCAPWLLTAELAAALRDEAEFYGRLAPLAAAPADEKPAA